MDLILSFSPKSFICTLFTLIIFFILAWYFMAMSSERGKSHINFPYNLFIRFIWRCSSRLSSPFGLPKNLELKFSYSKFFRMEQIRFSAAWTCLEKPISFFDLSFCFASKITQSSSNTEHNFSCLFCWLALDVDSECWNWSSLRPSLILTLEIS